MTQTYLSEPMLDDAPRPVAASMWRGAKSRCPSCGKGSLFRRFLKVTDQCPACGAEMYHHRADDLPAYLVIFVVGHIVIPALLVVEIAYAPPVWMHMTGWSALVIALSLALIQPIKGAVVGLQWALRMHGFGGDET